MSASSRALHAVLLEPSVFAVAGQLSLGFRRRRPVEPAGVKRPHHAIPDFQLVDTRTDRHYLAGAVAHRHARPGPPEEAHQIDVVVEVEARGLDLDQHLPGLGLVDRPFPLFEGCAGGVHHHRLLTVRNGQTTPALWFVTSATIIRCRRLGATGRGHPEAPLRPQVRRRVRRQVICPPL
jgi:hypothetical protein